MKRVSIVAVSAFCFGVLCTVEASGPSVCSSVQYETEHFNRGRPEMKKTVSSCSEIKFGVTDECDVYVGVDVALPVDADKNVDARSDVAPHVGCSYTIAEDITIDAGYIHHFYVGEKHPGSDGTTDTTGPIAICPYYAATQFDKKKDSGEVYAGVFTDFVLSPSLYCFYDFGKEEIAIEGKVSHVFDLSESVLNGLSVRLGGKIGYDKAKKPYGLKVPVSLFIHEDDGMDVKAEGYVYYSIGADMVLSIAEHIKISAGVSYEGNTASKRDMCNAYTKNNRRDAVVFRAGVACTF
ncbi:MAG: hypothetical protein LBR91_00775 [Puniceicoccales bacterium]|jgi:hypothetical protein|nr:hypothetical protein [Puniceicoccales bacterium]